MAAAPASPAAPALVGFVGSRSLSAASAPAVRAVVAAVLSSGRSVAVGCASGADALALSAAVSAGGASAVRVFAAGSAYGVGFLSPGVPAAVAAAVRAGASACWLAGGPLCVPLRVRLAVRARALVSAVAASGPGRGLVCFLPPGGPAASRGSWLAVSAAVAAGVPVVVFGFPAASLPPLGLGSWVVLPASAGPFAGAARWVPAF